MRLICISDTHMQHARLTLPEGDVLIHAGDFCGSGRVAEVQRFAEWIKAQPFSHKIVIAGNHDQCLDRKVGHAGRGEADVAERTLRAAGVIYLFDSGCDIDGIRFWGSPWTPLFGNWSFMESERELRHRWDCINNTPHVLITHGPAEGRLDRTDHGDSAGSSSLAAYLAKSPVALHICGHIHEGHGRVDQPFTSVNAAICDVRYRPVNPPQLVEIDLQLDQLRVKSP